MTDPTSDPTSDPIARVATAAAPAPAGHYAQATAWRDLVFVSGQLAARPDGSHTADRPFEEQARQALASLLAILAEAGSGPDRILRVTAYIVGVEHWPDFNRVYAEMLGEARPARTVVPVPELHHGYLVEVEATAVRGR
ncbi:RidA family protein [Methylobacterium nonmethylotrophicum]|uniref:RidA family protein n=1 Tax=Methylobacterium nonmethylotrophicum TaxID=1141884 RepID=A0A4Z0NLL8_9HYPH|nr:RidA family protein [Methylobacterium nonmethylotrophicum]TGD96613.1 RidA family protein [Methylobacterium nonmethylotrophicum]